jgi:hypothetical protein
MSDGQGASIALPIAALFYQKVFADRDLRMAGYDQSLEFDMPEIEDEPTEEIIIETMPQESFEEAIEGIFE